MGYQELKKLYYKSEEEYAAEYERRFCSEDAVHLDFKIKEKPAFFLETTEVLRLALRIEKLDREVSRLRHKLPGIAISQYSRKCMIDEIVLTNNIEGVHSSRKEIEEALDILEAQSREKKKHTRFEGLVHKYQKLMSQENIPLNTCRDIRNIYDEVFLKEVVKEDPDHRPDGEIFRKDAEHVYGSTGKVLHTGVYPEKKIIDCMERALNFLNGDSTEKLYRACIFHYLLEYIHPFYDGNGRLGRLILSYCISQTLEPLLAYRISETIKENIKQYYKAFETCNDRLNLGDLTPFLLMQMGMIYESLAELKESLLKKSTQLKRYQQMIFSLPGGQNKNGYNLYYLLIQAALFSEEGIPTPVVKEKLEIKSPTTFRKLIDQIPEELLASRTKNRIKYYELKLAPLDDMLMNEALQEK